VHVACGGGAFLLHYWPKLAVLALLACGVALVFAVQCYESRRGRQRNPFYRQGETALHNGAVRYAIGVAVAVILFPKYQAFAGWIIFAAGDGASSILGNLVPLKRLRNGLSAGGFFGFVITATLLSYLGSWWWFGRLPGLVPLLLTSMLCGAAELLISRVDDNYYLPSLAAALLLVR
jgi:dolichol kinase